MRRIRIGCFIIFLAIAMAGLGGIGYLILKFHKQMDGSTVTACVEQVKVDENGQPVLNEKTLQEVIEYKVKLRNGKTLLSETKHSVDTIYEGDRDIIEKEKRRMITKSGILLFVSVFFMILCLMIPLEKEEAKEPLRL